jgi:hypothetical protein
MPSIIQNSTSEMYANDAKVYMPIRNNADVALLQSDLSAIETWAILWCLPLNVKKCTIFRLREIQNVNNVYILNRTAPATVNHVKDLGVYFYKDLNFAYHCIYVYSCASRHLSLMLRCFVNRDVSFLVRMYKMYIRPNWSNIARVFGHHTMSKT